MSRSPDRKIQNIAIVTFGIETRVGGAMVNELQRIGKSPKDVLDLREKLRDPKDDASRVKYQTDGTHEWTQRAVYCQSNFAGLVCGEVQKANAGCCGLLLRACRTGYHRADVYGRTEKEALNRVCARLPNGTYARKFNAQHFPLCDIDHRDVYANLKLAVDWVKEPFGMCRGHIDHARESLYAHDACMTRPQAAATFKTIYDFVDRMSGRGPITPPPASKVISRS